MPDPDTAGSRRAASGPGRKSSEFATLAEIVRLIVQAELDQDALCELIYDLAGRIVPNDTFQLGLFDGDC